LLFRLRLTGRDALVVCRATLVVCLDVLDVCPWRPGQRGRLATVARLRQ